MRNRYSIWARQFDLDATLTYTKCGVTLFSGEATLDIEYLEEDGAVDWWINSFRFEEGGESVTVAADDSFLFNFIKATIDSEWVTEKVREEAVAYREDQMLDAAERRQEDRLNGY